MAAPSHFQTLRMLESTLPLRSLRFRRIVITGNVFLLPINRQVQLAGNGIEGRNASAGIGLVDDVGRVLDQVALAAFAPQQLGLG